MGPSFHLFVDSSRLKLGGRFVLVNTLPVGPAAHRYSGYSGFLSSPAVSPDPLDNISSGSPALRLLFVAFDCDRVVISLSVKLSNLYHQNGLLPFV